MPVQAAPGVIDMYEQMAKEGELTARVSVNIMAGLNGLSTYDSIIGGAPLKRFRH